MEDITHLLEPRYIVVAEYPGSKRKVGDIINNPTLKTTYEQYPHLFRKMKWWEDRLPQKFPEYVRNGKTVMHIDGITIEYVFNSYVFAGVKYIEGGQVIAPEYLRPATKYEYINYLQMLNDQT